MMDNVSIFNLIKRLSQSPGHLTLDELEVLKNFYTVYIECITVEIVSIHGELTELNMMGEYNIVHNKLERVNWYIEYQKNKLMELIKAYFEDKSKLSNFYPNPENSEFHQLYEILTNTLDIRKTNYKNSSIIQRLTDVSDWSVQLFRDMAKQYE